MLPEIVIGVPVRETQVNAFVDRIARDEHKLCERELMMRHYQDMIIARDEQIEKQQREMYELQKEVELLKSRLNSFNCTSF